MSIPVLSQVYDEARRLAVAGSAVARGDFRLKKLLPPLDQAGTKAPVFAKVAECARAVIDGLDDPYAEIADFLAEKVLPLYGRAILPELRKKYDPMGAKGDARRLALMHAIDPVGTHDLAMQGLWAGSSKDVKVAAIGC